MMNRQNLPQGCVTLKPRANGSDAWVYRFRDGEKHRSVVLGSVTTLKTKEAALRKAMRLRSSNFERGETMDGLIDLYVKIDMPRRHSTEPSYRSYLGRIRQAFGPQPIDDVMLNVMAVEQWLKGLRSTKGDRPLSKKTLSHIKAILHRLGEFAMKTNLLDMQRNPMSLVELKGVRSESRKINVLSVEQYHAIVAADLPSHVRVMIQVAMTLGLRASEVLGLRWDDLDLLNGTVSVQRSVVGKHTDDTKTEASREVLPIHPNLLEVLLAWRQNQPVIGGWVFGSPVTGRPYHRDTLAKSHLIPAGRTVGIPNLGWHTFRHTYRAMLRKLRLPLEVQQKLMRHADIRTTTEYGRGSMLDELRPANAMLAESLMEGRVM